MDAELMLWTIGMLPWRVRDALGFRWTVAHRVTFAIIAGNWSEARSEHATCAY